MAWAKQTVVELSYGTLSGVVVPGEILFFMSLC
jgi:hypothetical protein